MRASMLVRNLVGQSCFAMPKLPWNFYFPPRRTHKNHPLFQALLCSVHASQAQSYWYNTEADISTKQFPADGDNHGSRTVVDLVESK